jgi:hypothetical protein
METAIKEIVFPGFNKFLYTAADLKYKIVAGFYVM